MQNNFIDWCETYAFVEDKLSHGPVLFKLYDCQKRVARDLTDGQWLWILKARRLGLTWLLAAYATWLLTEHENRTIVVLNQNREYAMDFLSRVRSILDGLPADRKPKLVTDNKSELMTESGGSVRSMACTRRAIRSVTADLVIFDEAAYMDLLKDARKAAQPAVETGRGQVVAISTSNGPMGEFYDVWQQSASGKTRYKPVFLDWRELKTRDAEWYARESRENQADPLYMKREYPSSAEEAFESAEGRIYPLFIRSEKFIHAKKIHANWTKYRAIDFGGVDPFVCLWGAVIPGDGPGLSVDPCCDNLIRELLAYSYDANGVPSDKHNHACDALRYMVVSPPVAGHLHIYRELYLPNSAAKGFSLEDLGALIQHQTGGEQIRMTYADRSRADSIATLKNKFFSTLGQTPVNTNPIGEIIEGIVRVNELVVGMAKSKPARAEPERGFTGLPDVFRRRGIY